MYLFLERRMFATTIPQNYIFWNSNTFENTEEFIEQKQNNFT